MSDCINAACLQKYVLNPLVNIGVPVLVAGTLLGFGFTSPAVAAVAVAAVVVEIASHLFEKNVWVHNIALPIGFTASLVAAGAFIDLVVIDPVGCLIVGASLFAVRLVVDLLTPEGRKHLKDFFTCEQKSDHLKLNPAT